MPCTGQALVNAGTFLGEIDVVLDKFDHPGAHREHIWDLQVSECKKQKREGHTNKHIHIFEANGSFTLDVA